MKISRATRNRLYPLVERLRKDSIEGNDKQEKSRSTLVAERRIAADAIEGLLAKGGF